MNNKIKSEKFRKLSVAALVTGILAFSLIALNWTIDYEFSFYIIIIVKIFDFASFGLLIAAVVCGSIDLKRIKAGRYSNKGRGFDITGIVLGGIFILFYLVFLLLKVTGPLSH